MRVLVKMISRWMVFTGPSTGSVLSAFAFLAAGLAAGSGIISIAYSAEVASATQAPVPAEQNAALNRDPGWRVPRTSWGDPNLEGTFTSRDMSGIPMARPAQYGIRRNLTAEEFQQRVAAGGSTSSQIKESGPREAEDRLQLSALDSTETGTRIFGYTSYIIDPEDGQMPALTEEGRQRNATLRGGQANGPFYTMDDFSHYDRCITRGITGSIMPSLYGDAMRIVQSPTEVAITYEMLHDTRIIPLEAQAPLEPNVRQYLGSSVGHWEGETLVVETTNLTDKLSVGRAAHSTDLKLTERFTRIDPDMIDYVVHVDDPRTFVQPWTFRLTLTTQPDYEILEYSCHEGNTYVGHALGAEQLYQRRVAEARAKGEPVPEREVPSGLSLEIYAPPAAAEAVDINAGK